MLIYVIFSYCLISQGKLLLLLPPPLLLVSVAHQSCPWPMMHGACHYRSHHHHYWDSFFDGWLLSFLPHPPQSTMMTAIPTAAILAKDVPPSTAAIVGSVPSLLLTSQGVRGGQQCQHFIKHQHKHKSTSNALSYHDCIALGQATQGMLTHQISTWYSWMQCVTMWGGWPK